MTNKLLQNKYRIVILVTVFFLYLLNGTGVLDISVRTGLDLHFNFRILASLLSTIIGHPFHAQSLSLLLMMITGLTLSALLPIVSPIRAAIITLIFCIPHIYVYLITSDTQLILPMEYSLLIILVLFSMNALVTYFIETHSRQKLLDVFGQYVPPEVVNEISKYPVEINMGGESRIMTVFFCDIQDFSSIAEQLNPKQLTSLLNEYFNGMTDILFQYGATIDKYIGDSIMAFWGAPLPQSDHAERAVLAAFDMNKKIKQLSENFVDRGWPGPPMGIGINTGVMNVGNMGSKYRIAYTVIGDAVNLASRIEELTRWYNVPILVSEATKNECKNIVFREIDTVQVKGKSNMTKIYEPLCKLSSLTDEIESRMGIHQRGMEFYNRQDYGSAAEIFSELRGLDTNDKFYSSMLKRIKDEKNYIHN